MHNVFDSAAIRNIVQLSLTCFQCDFCVFMSFCLFFATYCKEHHSNHPPVIIKLLSAHTADCVLTGKLSCIIMFAFLHTLLQHLNLFICCSYPPKSNSSWFQHAFKVIAHIYTLHWAACVSVCKLAWIGSIECSMSDNYYWCVKAWEPNISFLARTSNLDIYTFKMWFDKRSVVFFFCKTATVRHRQLQMVNVNSRRTRAGGTSSIYSK